ncbi:MAG: hypothetical protein ACLS4Z_00705 [Christensenellaceae bacterium]
MGPKEIALIAVSVAAGVFLIALIVLTLKLRGVKKRAESDEKRADKVKIVHGVRYSEDDVISTEAGIASRICRRFYLIENGYIVRKGGMLLPGLYRASSGETIKFQIARRRLVKILLRRQRGSGRRRRNLRRVRLRDLKIN